MAAASGCYGGVGDGLEPEGAGSSSPGDDADAGQDDDSGGPAPASCDDGPQAAYVPMRRLTAEEYENTVRDALGVWPDEAMPSFPPDEAVGGYVANSVTALGVQHVEAYMAAAEALSDAVDVEALAPCPAGTRDCAEAFVDRVGRRLLRRPLTADQREALLAQYDQRVGSPGAEPSDGLRLVLRTLLQAPTFIYRPEFGAAGASESDEVVALDDYELATRLSFLLWASGPDDALLDAAAAGELRTAEGLRAQAERLLDDPLARRGHRSFHRQWLGLGRLDTLSKDPVLFPEFDPALRDAMLEETLRFVDATMTGPAATLDALFNGRRTTVNDALADLYGLPPQGDPEAWYEVELPAEQRAGILTQASFLAAQSNADQQSPILRGKFVRERLLCQTIPEPPPDADVTPPEIEPGVGPRERFEQHVSDPTCAGCHSLMDPIGFAFLHYDGVGRYMADDDGEPIDASGRVTNADGFDDDFDDALGLSAQLAASAEVGECMTRQRLRFALGRPERPDEQCSIERIDSVLQQTGDLREQLLELVESDGFRHTSLTPENGQ